MCLAKEVAKLKELTKPFKKFNSVQKLLQSEDVTLADTRAVFDSLLLVETYLSTRKHLVRDAANVQSPTFERVIVKVQNEQAGNGMSQRHI